MNCEDALLLLSGHLDQSNTPEEEAALQAHLRECETCRKVLQAFEEADAGISCLTEPAPADLRDGVMAQIKKEAAKKKRRPWFALAIAAALTLVIGVSAVVDPPEEEKSEPQTISAAETYTMSRSISPADSDALAVQISRERGAAVVVVQELYYEIETYPCESLEEGYLLYILPDHDAAVFLSETYGCIIYEPDADATVSYALLVP